MADFGYKQKGKNYKKQFGKMGHFGELTRFLSVFRDIFLFCFVRTNNEILDCFSSIIRLLFVFYLFAK